MKLIFSLFLGLFSIIVTANERTISYPALTDRAEISILTVGTGSELYTLFGHTALRIYDPLMRIDRVYNYGLFDFRTPNFYGKFIKGDLLYFGGQEDYREFVAGYAYEDRPVYEQHIKLTVDQKQELWQLVNRSLEENQKFYNYKFIHQNCTTKVVDLLNAVLKDSIQVGTSTESETYRTVLNQSLEGHYFEKLGINLLFSSKLDKKPTLLFLPNKLMQGLAITSIEGTPLVDKTSILYEKQHIEKVTWWNSYAFFSILLLIVALLMRFTWVRSAYFIVMGLLGVLLLFISFYSSHIELSNNDTFLLCNPVMLFLPWLAVNGFSKKYKYICAFVGLCILGFVILNINSEKLTITLPLVLLSYWALFTTIKDRRAQD